MSSWSGGNLGGSSWAGNPSFASKYQLLSTSAGLYTDIANINLSTINLSTLTVPDWISTGILYVSDIQGYNVIASNAISTTTGNFNVALASSITLKGIDLGGINVSFDFGLGQTVGGLLGGLGALVGSGLIAVGTGAGLAIQGAEQGIATMIAGRPENYINSNVYETINFTSQLQVSTLGNAYPAYSTIFRTVSSVSANTVPGREIYTSSIFYPGQICIRSASDPFNLITADSNLNTSTIQSFGQWVPLVGLEPEDIQANSISTNYIQANIISTNYISAGSSYIELAQFAAVDTYTILTSNIGIGNEASFNYNAAAKFDLGSSGDAAIFGYINQLNIQSDQPIVFSQLGDPGILPQAAVLTLGTGLESLLEISSITAIGNIQANSGYFSTLLVNDLIVVSTLSTIFSVTACNVLSTSLVSAYLVSTINLQAQYISPFQFSSILGNPIGPFDINKVDTVFSTTYDQVSSLTQNILNYSLNCLVQDEPIVDIGNIPGGVLFEVTPQNVSQWGSTILQYSGTNPGTIDLGSVSQWGVSPGAAVNLPGGATFDVFINPIQGVTNIFNLSETSNVPPYLPSTLFKTFGDNSNQYKLRMTLPPVIGGVRTGWWTLSNGFTPYATTNNNTFQIYQDINDSYIQATDRLHLVAGDISLDGRTTFSNIQLNTLNSYNIFNANNLITSTLTTSYLGYLSSISTNLITTSTINTNNITINPLVGGLTSFYYKSSIGFSSNPQTVTPFTATFKNDSPDGIPIFNLIPNFMGNNYFTSFNYTSWNNSIWNNNSVSAFQPNIYCGDLQVPLGTYSAFFYINNIIASPSYSLPVYYINASGSNLLGNVAGGTYGKVATADGINWVLTSVPNPVGNGGSYSNTLQMTQGTSYTDVVTSQNLQIQAPNTTLTTGTFGLFADQIRVNSHKYGTAPSAGLNSFPIGFQTGTYIDGNISWTQNPPASGIWQSDATNVIYGLAGIFFDYNSYRAIIIPSRFRTNTYPIYSWDVQVAPLSVPGGGYAWGYNRYIQIAAGPSGPGVNTTNNWNEWLMIPLNYCTN
jgi:hypothetical protein